MEVLDSNTKKFPAASGRGEVGRVEEKKIHVVFLAISAPKADFAAFTGIFACLS
jgi:hypothetical protein